MRTGVRFGSRGAAPSGTLSRLSAMDLLAGVTAYVRPRLKRGNTIGDRLRTLWAAVVAARDLAACDVVEDEFLRLASDTGLMADLGRHADTDVRHVMRWAMIGMNPFQ